MRVRTFAGDDIDLRWYEIVRWYRWWMDHVRFALERED